MVGSIWYQGTAANREYNQAPKRQIVTKWCESMNLHEKNITKKATITDARAIVEDIIKCKWSLTVIGLIGDGIYRPGAMVNAVDGLTTKVLNERLSKLQRYRILERNVFPEKPPRVEYRFSEFGEKFLRIIEAIDGLQTDIEAAVGYPKDVD